MLTLFAIPKAFTGHTGTIQRNAIRSWAHLRPKPEILLFGDDPGTEAAAAELGAGHLPHLERSEFGTPLMSNMFAQARRAATHDLLCFVNADIILTGSFLRAVERLEQARRRFIMFCTPWNVRIDQELDFAAGWEDRLAQQVRSSGQPPRPVGVDAVVFPRKMYEEMPPFAIARTCQDNWLIYRACHGSLPAVDATPYVLSVHQDHEGTTHWRPVDRNEQFERNQRLAQSDGGYWAPSYVAADLPYTLEQDGTVRKKGFVERLWPRMGALYNHPASMRWLNRTYAFRRRIGLHRKSGSESFR